jgi:ubiquinone/menaquinone biosynthesis C-methylase UbiE
MFMSSSLGEVVGSSSESGSESRSTAMSVERVVEVTAAVAEPTRLRILALLSEAELTVSELTEILRQSQPRVSRHLKVLVDGGLVRRTPEGAFAFFRVVRTSIESTVTSAMLSLVDPDDRILAADADRLSTLRAERGKASKMFFDANASNWERLRSLHVADDRVEAAIVELVAKTEPTSMLDIGTGTGRMLELLGPSVARGIGIDSSPKMLALARANLERSSVHHCSVRQGDLFDLDFPGTSFDLVVIHQVLHLLDEPNLALREAARVLAPGGTLLVVDFAPHQHEFLRTDQEHRRLGFGSEIISDWFMSVGLQPVDHQTLEGESADNIAISLWVGQKPRTQTIAYMTSRATRRKEVLA